MPGDFLALDDHSVAGPAASRPHGGSEGQPVVNAHEGKWNVI